MLSQNKIPKSFLFYGECDYQSDFYLKQILNLIGQSDKLSFYFDEFNYESALTHISQGSLFGEINVLIVKYQQKIPSPQLKKLIGVANNAQNSYFFLQFSGETTKARDMQKSFSKKLNSDFVRFFKPKIYEACNYIGAEARKLGVKIDNYAMEHLFMSSNQDLSMAVNELEKLSILNEPITYQQINKFSCGDGELGLEDFIRLILKKQDIKVRLPNILELYDEVKIINGIENYVVTLFMFYAYMKTHGQFNSTAILGYNLPPQIAQSRASESGRLNENQYQQILEYLLSCELKLKSSTTLNKSAYLLHSLIKLQTFL